MNVLVGILSFFLALAATLPPTVQAGLAKAKRPSKDRWEILLDVIESRTRCEYCASDSLTCEDHFKFCNQGYKCGSEFSYYNESGKISYSVNRYCMLPSNCHLVSSKSYENTKIITVNSCCDADLCTPSDSEILKIKNDFPTNGLVCPTCSSRESIWCEASGTVQCRGEEDMCLSYSEQEIGSTTLPSVIRGCATKSICDLGNSSIFDTFRTSYKTTICTSAKRP
ncbi:phospholipase A2 inhibitor NAI-like [Engystomops pustulosus]|uniref:phospholipase A2 inhibitor NAI-like n=1 Tax=Engystomops pustulosus TaxID=76066 RepID=UPI003AFA3E24